MGDTLEVFEIHEHDDEGRILAEIYTAPQTGRVTVTLHAGALAGDSQHAAIVKRAREELDYRGLRPEDVDWIESRP